MLLEQRKAVYEAARIRHPQRWNGPVRNWQRSHTVHLNPDQPQTKTDDPSKQEKTQTPKAT